MGLPDRFRSLLAYVLFRLIIPFTLILSLLIGAIIFVYQNSMRQLVLERHQQLANLAAVSVSQGIGGNAHVLEAFRSQLALRDPSPEGRAMAFQRSAVALEDFTAGVIQIDPQGTVITASLDAFLERGDLFPDPGILQALSTSPDPIFSSVVTKINGKNLILIGVAMIDPQGAFSGAILGGIDLSAPDNSINTVIQRLTTNTPGIAYVLDGRAIVISHPDLNEIGKDYSSIFTIGQVVHDSQWGVIWNSPEGERFVGAEAAITPSGWSVVIKEPWDAIIAPVSGYTTLIIMFGLLTLIAFSYLSWVGTRRVSIPIQKLARNTFLLASGEAIPAMEASGILEIDDLELAFARMAQQIASYRDGLRHYVDAMTRSQEEERLRIARELHDETIQNLLVAYRLMELYIASETDSHKRQQLGKLHDMVGQTLQGIRLISRDLRPMMLDDLGFIPAVQMLVRAAHEGKGAIPDVDLEVKGEGEPLPADHELALYRIVQEALTNVRKHACATRVRITIEYQREAICLAVEDDGSGFEVPASLTDLVRSGNMGLMGIQERIWSVRGTLTIHSRSGQGTQIIVTIPRASSSI